MDRPRLYRGLRIAASAVFGILCVLLVVLWVRSYHKADRLHGRIWDRQSFLLASKEGRIAAIAFRSHGAPGWWRWETRSYSVDDELSIPVGPVEQYESHVGFGWIVRPSYLVMRSTQTLPNGQTRTFMGAASATLNGAGPLVPIWFLVLLSGVLAAAPWIRWSMRFSLRTLLIATTLIAVLLGVIVAFAQ